MSWKTANLPPSKWLPAADSIVTSWPWSNCGWRRNIFHNELKEVLQPGTGKKSPWAALGCGSGMETEATQRGYLFRRAVPLQVPTKRLRGQIRIGRQPAWAFAVIMHSKRITSRFFPIGWDWLLGKIQDFDFEVIRPTRCHGKLQTCHHRSGSPQLTVL